MHIFPTPKTVYSDCDKAKDFLTKAGLSFTELPAGRGPDGRDEDRDDRAQGLGRGRSTSDALKTTNYPAKADQDGAQLADDHAASS